MSRVVVTGGAGFVGSHLCKALLARGDEVVCVDNLSTGSMANVDRLAADAHFTFVQGDVSDELHIDGRIDAVAHLACPASPPDYLRLPLETLAAGSGGTEWGLRLAERYGGRFLLASTSEIYGEPTVHPQPESYWGNVNPIGPRSVYDESKRFAEALTMAHHRALGADVGIVRIFNTYGPQMRLDDGRVVSNFVTQALGNRPLTVYGDGAQTRSICYVDDLVGGLVAMLDSSHTGPFNLGNPTELTMMELAHLVVELTGASVEIVHRPLPEDDPTRRRPDVTRAREALGWRPTISPREGLQRTIEWFKTHVETATP
ncbi:MAG: UDP-glucuronic acid decarboxylase family protein [Acidimicrobiales bacterium]